MVRSAPCVGAMVGDSGPEVESAGFYFFFLSM